MSDEEWAIVEPHVPAPMKGGRPAKWSRREILNAILYVLKTGCPWNLLPHDFPPYSTVFWYFRRWRMGVATNFRELNYFGRIRVTKVPSKNG